MFSADNLISHIIVINNIKNKVPVTTKLTPVKHHKHRCPYISFKYLLPCKSFIFAKDAKEMKYFLKVKINLSHSQKKSKSLRENNIYTWVSTLICILLYIIPKREFLTDQNEGSLWFECISFTLSYSSW